MTETETMSAEQKHILSRIEEGRHYIPDYMVGAVERYLLYGMGPGGFLTAVLENDLMGAIGRADLENQRAIVGWATFVYNYIPSTAHGSPEKVAAWINSGGIEGQERAMNDA